MNAADQALVDRVVGRTLQLAAVPAPPLHEARRAAMVQGWWEFDGLDEVHLDGVGNVWARVRDGAGPAIVVAAHLDTVFGEEVEHVFVSEDGRIAGPGIGDNTISVAALAALDDLLPPTAEAPSAAPVWIVGTVGEEGIGDLAGAREVIARPPTPIAAFIAVEGNYLGRVATVGVGSHRWRATITGPGGHAWERADAPSAVHAAAALVHELVHIERPSGGRTAINVGRIGGGEAINARGRHAWFEIDVRSDDAPTLESLVGEVERILSPAHPALDGLAIACTPIGARPAGHIRGDQPLVRAAEAALRAVGIEPQRIAASTDANAAFAVGLPAITVGITIGQGEHTPQEWIDLAPICDGLDALAETVSLIMEGAAG